MQTVKTVIPFSGFYHSDHDAELDAMLERDAEAIANGESDCFVFAAGEAESVIAERLHDATDWGKTHDEVALTYARYFVAELASAVRASFELVSCKMHSPRFYNFETDSITVEIPASAVAAIAARVDHQILRDVISERHSSRSGFVSFYSNDYAEWMGRPYDEWDENELCTLIIAAIRSTGHADNEDSLEQSIIDRMRGNGVYDGAWSLDSAAFERAFSK